MKNHSLARRARRSYVKLHDIAPGFGQRTWSDNINSLHVLSLQPFYGGSHRAFQDGWARQSRHNWTLMTLPAAHWKWRMRHSAVEFANQLKSNSPATPFDVVFCTDMINLAEFRGLVSPEIANLPAVVYFHENQFAYPSQNNDPRDMHYAFTNVVSCLAADQVWFNSCFNRDSLIAELKNYCQRWPDFAPRFAIEQILDRGRVMHPGIDIVEPVRQPTKSKPPHIVWAARWEHDKNPGDLLRALSILKEMRVPFRLSLLGQSFREVPPEFAEIKQRFSEQIEHWGYTESRQDFIDVLSSADLFVSTAVHEFFGLAVAEAIACGAFPLLPNRLAYPELLQSISNGQSMEAYLYDGSATDLANRMEKIIANTVFHEWRHESQLQQQAINQLSWVQRAELFDNALSDVVARFQSSSSVAGEL